MLIPTVASLQSEIAAILAKWLDLECCSQQSSLCLMGTPEGIEPLQTNKICYRGIAEWFDVCECLFLAQVCWMLAARPAKGQRLWLFVTFFFFYWFSVKEEICRRPSKPNRSNSRKNIFTSSRTFLLKLQKREWQTMIWSESWSPGLIWDMG